MADLTEELVEALKIVLDPETMEDIQLGLITNDVQASIKVVDDVLDRAKTKSPLTLYRGYNGVSKIPANFQDDNYYVASTKPPKADTVFKKNLPEGSKALELGGGYYILPRGTSVAHSTPETKLALQAAEEFFNKWHSKKDGKFTSKPTGDNSGEGGISEEKSSALKKVAVGLAAAAVVAVVVVAVLSKGTSGISKPDVHDGDEYKPYSAPTPEYLQKRQKTVDVLTKGRERMEDNLSFDEIKAHAEYTGAGYRAINDYLRTGKTAPRVPEAAQHLDSAFQKGSTETGGATLYRGILSDRGTVSKLKEGQIITDKAYTSTSMDKGIAVGFTKKGQQKNNKILMEIKTKKDTKFLPGTLSETEFILNRGSNYKVTKVTHCKDGICRLEVEVV